MASTLARRNCDQPCISGKEGTCSCEDPSSQLLDGVHSSYLEVETIVVGYVAANELRNAEKQCRHSVIRAIRHAWLRLAPSKSRGTNDFACGRILRPPLICAPTVRTVTMTEQRRASVYNIQESIEIHEEVEGPEYESTKQAATFTSIANRCISTIPTDIWLFRLRSNIRSGSVSR